MWIHVLFFQFIQTTTMAGSNLKKTCRSVDKERDRWVRIRTRWVWSLRNTSGWRLTKWHALPFKWSCLRGKNTGIFCWQNVPSNKNKQKDTKCLCRFVGEMVFLDTWELDPIWLAHHFVKNGFEKPPTAYCQGLLYSRRYPSWKLWQLWSYMSERFLQLQ